MKKKPYIYGQDPKADKKAQLRHKNRCRNCAKKEERYRCSNCPIRGQKWIVLASSTTPSDKA